MKKMKSSNKILLITGMALVLVPIFGMFAVSRIYFEKGMMNKIDVIPQESKTFQSKEEGMRTQKQGSFQVLNFDGIKGIDATISYYPSADYGIKFKENLEGHLTILNNGTGDLSIKIKDPNDLKSAHIYLEVYSPNIKSLVVNNSKELQVFYNADSLNLVASHAQYVNIAENDKLQNLRLNANAVKELNLIKNNWKSLIIDAKAGQDSSSDFRFQQNTIGNLQIKAEGNMNVEFMGKSDFEKEIKIQELSLQTIGPVNLKMSKASVEKANGEISDQTQLSIPARIINLIYKH